MKATAEEIQAFVEQVNDAKTFPRRYPLFMAAFVIPNQTAFRQFVMEVLLVGNMSAAEWMTSETRRRYGWPQAIEDAYNAFVEEQAETWARHTQS